MARFGRNEKVVVVWLKEQYVGMVLLDTEENYISVWIEARGIAARVPRKHVQSLKVEVIKS